MSRSVRKGSSDVDGAVLDLACCKQYFKQHRDGLNKSAPDGNCFDLPEQIFGVMQGRDRMALQDYFVELTGRSVTGWDSRGQIPAWVLNGRMHLGAWGQRLNSYWRYGHVAYFQHWCTPLHWACHLAQVDVESGKAVSAEQRVRSHAVIQYLLEQGADPTIEDGWGHDVFELLCTHPTRGGGVEPGLAANPEMRLLYKFVQSVSPGYRAKDLYTGEAIQAQFSCDTHRPHPAITVCLNPSWCCAVWAAHPEPAACRCPPIGPDRGHAPSP